MGEIGKRVQELGDPPAPDAREPTVCEYSGDRAVGGACPLHGGDACLVHLPALRAELTRLTEMVASLRAAAAGAAPADGPTRIPPISTEYVPKGEPCAYGQYPGFKEICQGTAVLNRRGYALCQACGDRQMEAEVRSDREAEEFYQRKAQGAAPADRKPGDEPYEMHTAECQRQAEGAASEGESPRCICGAFDRWRGGAAPADQMERLLVQSAQEAVEIARGLSEPARITVREGGAAPATCRYHTGTPLPCEYCRLEDRLNEGPTRGAAPADPQPTRDWLVEGLVRCMGTPLWRKGKAGEIADRILQKAAPASPAVRTYTEAEFKSRADYDALLIKGWRERALKAEAGGPAVRSERRQGHTDWRVQPVERRGGPAVREAAERLRRMADAMEAGGNPNGGMTYVAAAHHASQLREVAAALAPAEQGEK